MWNSSGETPFGIYVFLCILGMVGLWTTSVVLLRGKTVKLEKGEIILRPFLSTNKIVVSKNQIQEVQNFTRSDSPYMVYELLIFKTSDNKEFWIISYEFNDYKKLKTWLFKHSQNITAKAYSPNDFLQSQYLTPLLLSLLLFVLLMVPLYLKLQ